MDVLYDQLVSVTLNVLGFAAAGMLWVVLFAQRGRTHRATKAVNVPAAPRENTVMRPAPTSSPRPERVQFLDLSAAAKPTERPDPIPPKQSSGAPGGRRNRAEVLALARRMLQEGRSGEQIRRTLPIAEGELSLLNQTPTV